MLLPLVSLSLVRLSLLLPVSRCDAAPVARPVTRITLALAANNTAKVCPAGTMRISALSPWDGDLNAGAHVPTPWTPQCGEALHARCGLAKVPGAHVSCVGCLQNNSAALLEANCTQDSAVAWCAQPAAGSFVHLCFGVVATERPVSNLCAFTTPSNADPDGDCPHGWEKIDGESPEHNFNTGSTNVGAGYICMQRALSQQDGELSSQDQATAPIIAIEGGLASQECPADTSPVLGCAGSPHQGPVDFDPNGVGVRLCMRRGYSE